ncbi:MAG: hypothetical protein Q7T11_05115 [Deltaproteobacteria bacterium]|nr:hypothetical protein [Deltaproteobacteria bacterium]
MPLNSAEQKLKRLLQLWIVLFSAATFVFYFGQHFLFRTLNDLSFHLSSSLKPIPLPTERFWLSLTMSLMITLVFLCYQAQKDIRTHLKLVAALLVSKFASTLFFFVSFVLDERYGAYLVGIFVDGSIFLITTYFYQKAASQRPQVMI